VKIQQLYHFILINSDKNMRTFILKTDIKNMRYAEMKSIDSPYKKVVSQQSSLKSGSVVSSNNCLSNYLAPDYLKRKSQMEIEKSE
jgi:hypothetical protein